ncbi:MAG: hypothetical protein GC137_08115 [Alphaproteobacteria bacterium]|nr:hypothetical protein [Alphaproteobacteria bacterium]
MNRLAITLRTLATSLGVAFLAACNQSEHPTKTQETTAEASEKPSNETVIDQRPAQDPQDRIVQDGITYDLLYNKSTTSLPVEVTTDTGTKFYQCNAVPVKASASNTDWTEYVILSYKEIDAETHSTLKNNPDIEGWGGYIDAASYDGDIMLHIKAQSKVIPAGQQRDHQRITSSNSVKFKKLDGVEAIVIESPGF